GGLRGAGLGNLISAKGLIRPPAEISPTANNFLFAPPWRGRVSPAAEISPMADAIKSCLDIF
ncbi:MAG: hypothetical protein AAB019_04380, partial [Planctomycetota bacterium]